MAALPDTDLLIPHFHRTATHSLTATLLICIVAAAVTARATIRSSETGGALGRIGWSAVVMCAAAHASHILLDWLNSDPSNVSGIQVLWPFSNRLFISGWELGLLGPLVIALWWLRQRARRTMEVAAPTE